jgi:hypothetical protein
MRFSSSGLVLASLVAAASPLGAQRPDSSAACDSVLRRAYVDSVAVTARAYLVRRDGELLVPRLRELLLERILEHFTAPTPLRLPVFGPGPARLRMLHPESLGDSLTIRAPVVYGVYDFTVRSSGAMVAIQATVPSIMPGFDERVLDAIRGLARDSAITILARTMGRRDSGRFELRVTTGPEDTRFRVPAATVFAANFPRIRLVDAKPVGANPLPVYPEEERDEGGDGEVLLRVVVDERGAPVIATLEVLHATSPAFALSAARALARYHFVPAHVGACGVPQVMELPFWFSLRP